MYLALTESLSKEDNLRNHGRVWYNHRDGSEHALQVVRQLSSTGIARVHCDKDATRVGELDLTTLKQEPSRKVGESLENGEDLLGHH